MADNELRLSYQEERQIEAYAAALCDMMTALTGDNPCAKRYDPLTIEGGIMHSYAFNMKDGGRHHPITDYDDVDDIKAALLKDAVEWCQHG